MPGQKVYGSASVNFVTSGTYQRTLISAPGGDTTADTEQEVSAVADNIKGDGTSDAMYSWVRLNLKMGRNDGLFVAEWMLIRCLKTDAIQNLNDSAAIEALHKDGKLIKRGFAATPATTAGGWQTIKFEIFNVKLNLDEELRLVVCPWVTCVDTFDYYGILEWRQVGV